MDPHGSYMYVKYRSNQIRSSIRGMKTYLYLTSVGCLGVLIMFYSASNMFVSNGIDTFAARIRLLCYRFIERVNSSKNEIVNCISGNSWVINKYAWKHWESILYIKRVTCPN